MSQPFATSHALVIGINAYSGGIPLLRTAAADAERIGDVLEREHGYRVRRVLDGAATRTALTELLTTELARSVGSDDRVLVYFAGHGVAMDGEDGPRGYILPSDARQGDEASFLSMTSIHDALLALPCRHMLLVLDCCFAGAFRWSVTRDVRRTSGTVHRERYDRFVRDPAWQVLTSAAHDQKALDILTSGPLGARDDSGQHSPFALGFLDALAGAADLVPHPEGDGLLTATELYLFLEDRLQPATTNAGARQTPELWPLKRHDKGEFLFFVPGRELKLPEAPPLTFELNPYRGLSSYERAHKDTFFGRERVIAALKSRVHEHQLTVVLGASGTGKSSVVKAGLVPALEADTDRPYHLLPVLRPGAHPLGTLKQACLALDGGEGTPVRAMQRWCEAHPDRYPVLVIDQFEELATLCASLTERQDTMSLLAHLLDACPVLRVILTIRTDFEPQLAHGALEARWGPGRFVVPPVTQAELRQIIEGPASHAVMHFEPSALVDALIDEVVQTPGGLPLLSFTLSEMYVRSVKAARGDRAMTRADYDALGGVVGALRHAANEVHDGLDAPHRDTMRRVMLRMVSAAGGNVTRRRVALAELEFDEQVLPGEHARVQHVLETLVAARLVVRGRDGDGDAFVEPAHDALVNAWDLLIEWLHVANQQGPPLALRERLANTADDWTRAPKAQRAALLWKDASRASQLRNFLRGKADWLNARERRFAERSVRGWRVGVGIAVGVVLAIAAGGVAAAIFGLDARRKGVAAQVAADRASAAARQAQSNAIASLTRAEGDPVIRAQLLNEIVQAGLPAPNGGAALVMHTARALDSALVPWRIGTGWDFAEGRNEDGTTARVLMTLTLERLYAGGLEFSRYTFTRSGAAEAAAMDPMPRDEYEQPWGGAAAFDDHVVQYTSGSRYATDTPARRLWTHSARVNRLAFSVDGTWLVSSSDDGTARRWRVESDSVTVFDAGDGAVVDVAISLDGDVVATAHASGASRVWRVTGGVAQQRAAAGTTAHPTSIAVSGDGAVVAVGDSAGGITVWESATGRVRRTLIRGSAVDAVALTHDGAGVISLAGNRLSVARTDEPSIPITVPLERPNDRDYGFAMPQWNARYPSSRPRPRISVAGSGKRALVVGPGGVLSFWPVILPAATLPAAVPRTASAPTRGWRVQVTSNKLDVSSPDGRTRYTLSPQGSLGDVEGTETNHQFSPDSTAVAVWHRAGGQWNMSAFDLTDGRKIFDMGSAGELMCLSLAPRGTHIAWCPTRFTPEIIPLPPEVSATGSGAAPRALPVPTIGVIDTTGFGGFPFVKGVAFSPDHMSVVVWGDYLDAVVSRIDGTGEPVLLPAGRAPVVAARFTDDGRFVLLTSSDGEVRRIAVGFDEGVQGIAARVPYCLGVVQRVQYLGESDAVAREKFRECELQRRTKRAAP